MQFTLTWKTGSSAAVDVPDADLRAFVLGYWKRLQLQTLEENDRGKGELLEVKASA